MPTTALGPIEGLDSLPGFAARHGLFSTALEPSPSDTPNRWRAGFTYHPPICGQAGSFSVESICDKTVSPLSDQLPRHSCSEIDVMPFVVRSWHKGDLLDRDRAVERASLNLDATASLAAERILSNEDRECRLTWAGTTEVNSRDAADPIAPSAALAELTQYLATNGGGRGMLWATPALAHFWYASGALTIEAGRLITIVGGHWVVAGQGLTGNGPGNTVPGGSLQWAYATDPAFLLTDITRIDGADIRDSLALDTNDQTVVARQTAAVFWNHCRQGAQCVDMTLADTGGGGGGGGTGTDAAPLIQRPSNEGPQLVVTTTRATGAGTTNIAADALRVSVVVLADGVTVEGSALPAGVAVDFGIDGYRTDALAVVLDATGDVFITEERAA